jgi:hypothetical protein
MDYADFRGFFIFSFGFCLLSFYFLLLTSLELPTADCLLQMHRYAKQNVAYARVL